MGNQFCTNPNPNVDYRPKSRISTIKNFEPQTTLVISQGIPNVSAQIPGNPQQNHFEFNDTYFESRFECGNLAQVERTTHDTFDLWIAPDCYKTRHQVLHQSWFFFKVEVRTPFDPHFSRTIQLRIKNILSKYQIQFEGTAPVYHCKSTNHKWEHLPSGIHKIERDGEFTAITFQHKFTIKDSKVYFAYSFPYTYSDLNSFLSKVEKQCMGNKKIVFQRERLTKSLEGRAIELFTITGKSASGEDPRIIDPSSTSVFTSGESQELLSPTFVKGYPDRKYVLITSRALAADTSSSYALEGLIEALVDPTSNESAALWENFVFLIIPMLNPDGVVRGQTVTDVRGKRINTAYKSNVRKEHYPVNYAINKLMMGIKSGIYMYWDLESISSKSGTSLDAYMIGNLDYDADAAVIGRLLGMHTKSFKFQEAKLVHCDGILKSLPLAGASVRLEDSNITQYAQSISASHNQKRPYQDEYTTPKALNRDFKALQRVHRGLARNFLASVGNTHLAFTLKINDCRKHQIIEASSPEEKFLQASQEIQENKESTEKAKNKQGKNSNPIIQASMKEIGSSLLDAILEFNSLHPSSCLANTEYLSPADLKEELKFLLKQVTQNGLRSTIA